MLFIRKGCYSLLSSGVFSMQLRSSLRRTKIVATIGPATSSPDTLRALIEAGATTLRLNFSHGTHEDHQRSIRLIR